MEASLLPNVQEFLVRRVQYQRNVIIFMLLLKKTLLDHELKFIFHLLLIVK